MINHKDLTWKFIRIEKQSKNIHQLHKYKSSSVENHTLHNSELLNIPIAYMFYFKHSPERLHLSQMQVKLHDLKLCPMANQHLISNNLSNGEAAFDFQCPMVKQYLISNVQWWSRIWFPMSNGEAAFEFQWPMAKQHLISNEEWHNMNFRFYKLARNKKSRF